MVCGKTSVFDLNIPSTISPSTKLENSKFVLQKNVTIVFSVSLTTKIVLPKLLTVVQHLMLHVEGKAIPLQAWTGPEGSRSLRLPDFKTIGT